MTIIDRQDNHEDPEFIAACKKSDAEKELREANLRRDFGAKVLSEQGKDKTIVLDKVGMIFLARSGKALYTTSCEIEVDGGYTAEIGFREDTYPELLRILKQRLPEHYRTKITDKLEKEYTKPIYIPWFTAFDFRIEAVLGSPLHHQDGREFIPFYATKVEEIRVEYSKRKKRQSKKPQV